MAKKKDSVEAAAQILDNRSTFNPLLNALRENDKKNLFRTNVTTAFIKTGFPLFDYYFGAVINIHDELGRIIRQEPRVGQAAGTFNLIVGITQSGKTTLAAQLAANIIRQFSYANIIHFDCEYRFDVSRAETITKLPSYFFDGSLGPERYMIRTGAVGLDVIQEMIVKTYVTKMKLRKEMTIDSGYKDEFGNPVMIMQPTVVLIDSMTTVLNETFSPDNAKEASEAEKMRANTEGARDAKTVKGFFKDILPLCKEANIIIYGINHINNNMSMNSFVPVAKQQNYLKQDEIIPGGKSMVYYPFNIIKLIPKPSDDFTEEGDGFAGHIVMVEPIKSSSNQSGNNSKGISFELVFDFKHGFDSLRSLINYGKEYGLIEGNRNRMRIKGSESDYTFSSKNLYNDMNEKPIWEDIKKIIIPHLDTHLSYIEPTEISYNDKFMDY